MAGFVEVVPGLHRLGLTPLDLVNVYLLDRVLVDSGTVGAARKLVHALKGRRPLAHALTHGHPDHQGATRAVCQHFRIALWCGEGDRRAVESGATSELFANPSSLMARLSDRMSGPPHHVDRSLQEGDTVGGFTVIETPGHTPGHLSFWRASDRVLVVGDVLFHRSPVTLRKGLTEPFGFATHDPAANRDSARKLAALEPEVICFGHGPPLRDAQRFQDFVRDLPG